MALISGGSKGGMPMPMQSSSMKNTPVGSGSRPVPSKHKIETSSPMNAKTLDRDPPSPLK